MGVALYGVVYLLALAPGLPVGFALFGRRHAAGWIVGAALGYFFTTLALWSAIAIGHPSAAAFAIAWLAVIGITWASTRGVSAPLLTASPWRVADTRALILVLLLVPAIAGPPFARLGATDSAGNRYYR